MSTTTTYYITTANYGTRVAEYANSVATQANNYINALGELKTLAPQVQNIQAALDNAAAANTLSQTANAVAFLANGTADYANATANIANIVAKQANDVVTYLNPIVIGMQGNVTNLTTNVLLLQSNVRFLQSNVSNLETNVWRIEPNVWRLEANLNAFENLAGNIANLEANVRYLQANVSNLQANLWRIEPNVWRIEANLVKFEQLSGNVANLESNVTMLWSNVNRLWINVNTTNTVAVLASNIANYANATANTANTILNTYYANLVNLPNLYAFAANANTVAQLANTVAYQANDVANQANTWLTQNYANVLYWNSVFQQINLNGLALWSNGTGNIYTYSNVGIGTMSTNDGNVLSVLGNVYISGNLNVVGGLRTTTVPTGTVYTPKSAITIPSANVGSSFILNLTDSLWNQNGSAYTRDANSIKFTQIGLYTAVFNILAKSGSEYDSLVSVNVYTNTNNTLTNASLFASSVVPAVFGPQLQPITLPLSITDISNNYIITGAFYRNTYPYTIQTSSFVQLGMMSQLGIPVLPPYESTITVNDGKTGIRQKNPHYILDVDGDVNLTGALRINGNPGWDIPSSSYVKYDGAVAIGYASPVTGNSLSVFGNVNTSGYLFSNVYYCSGLPFNYGTNNVYTNQNVLMTQNLTVLGNIIGGPWSYTDSVNLYTSYSNVTVNGNVKANYLIGDLTYASGIPQNQAWGILGSNVYTDTTKVVCIGTANAATGNILTVSGNLSVNNFIFGNISLATGLYTPWQQGTNNTYITSNIGIGTSAVGAGNVLSVQGNVFLNGNVYITGKLSAEQVFMIACSDESSGIIPKSNAVTFRSPGRWYLTKIPRISLLTAPITAGANVNVFVNRNTSTPMLTSNLCIPFNAISSASQSLSWDNGFNRILNSDDLVNINITRGDTTATGLKIVFYYMDIQ